MPRTKLPITARQARFIEEYVIDCDATNSAIRAGFSERTSDSIGHQLLGKPLIADAIAPARAKLARKADVTAERVIAEFAAIAFLNPADYYDEDGNLLPIREMPEAARRAITGIDVEEIFAGRGEERRQIGVLRKIRFAQKQPALDSLAKHLGLFQDGAPPTSRTLTFGQINEIISDEDAKRVMLSLASRMLPTLNGGDGNGVDAVEALKMKPLPAPGPESPPSLRLVKPEGG